MTRRWHDTFAFWDARPIYLVSLVAGLAERGLAAGPIEFVGVPCEKW